MHDLQDLSQWRNTVEDISRLVQEVGLYEVTADGSSPENGD